MWHDGPVVWQVNHHCSQGAPAARHVLVPIRVHTARSNVQQTHLHCQDHNQVRSHVVQLIFLPECVFVLI